MSDNTRHARAPVGGASCMMRISFTDEPGGSFTDEYCRSKASGRQDHRWWSQTGSNRRPPACKAGALPTELWPRSSGELQRKPRERRLVGLGRFELPTSRLSSARSNQLSYRPNSNRVHTLDPRPKDPLRAKGCSNDLWIAWARPRRKRNVDGEVLQIGMPILKLTCPDVSKRSDRSMRMLRLKDHP